MRLAGHLVLRTENVLVSICDFCGQRVLINLEIVACFREVNNAFIFRDTDKGTLSIFLTARAHSLGLWLLALGTSIIRLPLKDKMALILHMREYWPANIFGGIIADIVNLRSISGSALMIANIAILVAYCVAIIWEVTDAFNNLSYVLFNFEVFQLIETALF